MCLVIKVKQNWLKRIFKKIPPMPQIAKGNIRCFKVYEKTRDGTLLSTAMKHENVLGLQPVVKLGINNVKGDSYTKYNVEEGYHSFIHKRDAFALSRQYSGYAVYQCIIPKGTTYYEGTLNGGEPNYVSSQIIILKEVER